MTLRMLLDDNVHFDAEYGGGLSNHLPMALVALHGLGASDARLAAFAESYRRRLAPAPGVAAWPSGDAWASRFGQPEAWAAYRALFAEWLFHEPRDAVLAQVLPALMPGCGAAAFHGLIRTAYAVASGHDGELADGLAYWACRYLPLDGGAGEGLEAEPGVVLQALRRALSGWRSDAGLIVQRMQEASLQPAFAPQVMRLRIGADALRTLAQLATRLYAQSGNFTVLHLGTGCHALRVLMPCLDAPLPALRSYWVAYAAGAAGVLSAVAAPTLQAVPDWPEIVARALASDDEHVVKLVYSCREEHRFYGWDDCRFAAARAMSSALSPRRGGAARRRGCARSGTMPPWPSFPSPTPTSPTATSPCSTAPRSRSTPASGSV